METAETFDSSLTGQSTNDQIFASITKKSVESVQKQCRKYVQKSTEKINMNTSSSVINPGFKKRPRNIRNRQSKDYYEVRKMGHPYEKCGKHEYWMGDQNTDGTIPSHVK